MDAESLNSQLTKFYTFMMVVGASLMVTNLVSSVAIEIGVEVITLIVLLILGIVLSILYVGLYVAIMLMSYKNCTHFMISWGSDTKTALHDAYCYDNTLILCGSTCLIMLFVTHSWILWGAFGVALLMSLITSLRILMLHVCKGSIEETGANNES